MAWKWLEWPSNAFLLKYDFSRGNFKLTSFLDMHSLNSFILWYTLFWSWYSFILLIFFDSSMQNSCRSSWNSLSEPLLGMRIPCKGLRNHIEAKKAGLTEKFKFHNLLNTAWNAAVHFESASFNSHIILTISGSFQWPGPAFGAIVSWLFP